LKSIINIAIKLNENEISNVIQQLSSFFLQKLNSLNLQNNNNSQLEILNCLKLLAICFELPKEYSNIIILDLQLILSLLESISLKYTQETILEIICIIFHNLIILQKIRIVPYLQNILFNAFHIFSKFCIISSLKVFLCSITIITGKVN
jgi:hypothetical protein